MRAKRVVAAHHDIEQAVTRRFFRIEIVGCPGKNLGIDPRHEGRHERRLVGMQAMELAHAEARRLGEISQAHPGESLLGDQRQEGVDRAVRCLAHPASSLERRDAAASALSKMGWSPSAAISTFKASAVVPPGLVTLTRNCAAGSADCRSNSPLPITVARASCMAMSGARPSLVPAAAIA